MSRKISERERIVDYGMNAPLEQVKADISLLGRIVANRVKQESPEPESVASKPRRKRRTKQQIIADQQAAAAKQGA